MWLCFVFAQRQIFFCLDECVNIMNHIRTKQQHSLWWNLTFIYKYPVFGTQTSLPGFWYSNSTTFQKRSKSKNTLKVTDPDFIMYKHQIWKMLKYFIFNLRYTVLHVKALMWWKFINMYVCILFLTLFAWTNCDCWCSKKCYLILFNTTLSCRVTSYCFVHAGKRETNVLCLSFNKISGTLYFTRWTRFRCDGEIRPTGNVKNVKLQKNDRFDVPESITDEWNVVNTQASTRSNVDNELQRHFN